VIGIAQGGNKKSYGLAFLAGLRSMASAKTSHFGRLTFGHPVGRHVKKIDELRRKV
jgi:hypothetical protein